MFHRHDNKKSKTRFVTCFILTQQVIGSYRSWSSFKRLSSFLEEQSQRNVEYFISNEGTPKLIFSNNVYYIECLITHIGVVFKRWRSFDLPIKLDPRPNAFESRRRPHSAYSVKKTSHSRWPRQLHEYKHRLLQEQQKSIFQMLFVGFQYSRYMPYALCLMHESRKTGVGLTKY